jgi:hypothetical protein
MRRRRILWMVGPADVHGWPVCHLIEARDLLWLFAVTGRSPPVANRRLRMPILSLPRNYRFAVAFMKEQP